MIEGPTAMYTTSHHPGQSAISTIGGDLDESGTINPAALNSQGSILPGSAALNNANMQSPRGMKRSRSPEPYSAAAGAGTYGENDSRPKKRGKAPDGSEDPGLENSSQADQKQVSNSNTATSAPQSRNAQGQQQPQTAQAVQTPATPAAKQTSPAKPASGKSVVKALPTVRDHTTDQLNSENDEYMPRETDPDGDKKVLPNGRLTGEREYKCRTFLVPNRGDKLFMLATECARVLTYRDSYLLFNKNRSLYKIIATQAEKDDLIHQDILPYSYRSRQIAIVTARSMFRQFGSRVITNGRRVRDDYWEAKARKQGFTEDDMAGEKRPGAAKRDAAAHEAAASAAAQHPPSDVVYSTLEQHGHTMPMGYGFSNSYGPLPMITPAPSDDRHHRYDYSNITRPKQEINGPPYQDKSQLSNINDVMGHAAHTAEYSRQINQQRSRRSEILNETWERKQPVSPPLQQDSAATPSITQTMQSPHMAISSQQPMMPPQPAHATYPHQGASQGSPSRAANQHSSMSQRAGPMPYGSAQVPQSPGYGYPTQMWQQHPAAPGGAPPQQSPLAPGHTIPQYSPQTPGQGQAQSQSPHPSQSPHHMPHQAPGHQQPPQPMGGYQMPTMGMQPAYGMAGRAMYQQPGQAPPTYIQPSGPNAAGSMAGWAPPGGQQAWQGQGY